MLKNSLPRLDLPSKEREILLKSCRLKPGEIWIDPIFGHRVGCLDSAKKADIKKLMGDSLAALAVHDPPYNLVAFDVREVSEFIFWCKKWISISIDYLSPDNASLYIWCGADQNNHFSPLPEFILMMKKYFPQLSSRSFITMRNQRGYGTQKNWMALRQELLYYTIGDATFHVQYTDIPRKVKGYYKKINGQITENSERSKSDCIRPGNVWTDIQQIFYRMKENVEGCYAQKPLKAIERIILASSNENNIVLDFFAHSGATLLAAEKNKRVCYTTDIDPLFCEIAIRRLLHYRKTGETGYNIANDIKL